MEKMQYSISEAAEMLGLHPNTLRNWSKDGVIETTMVVGKRYLSAETVKGIVNKNGGDK